MLAPLELKMLEVRSWDLAVPQAMLQEPIRGVRPARVTPSQAPDLPR